MRYTIEMVGKIAEWLKSKNPTSQIAFDYEEGNFIVKPDGELYEIEIPYLKAERIMQSNGAEDRKMDELFEYAKEEADDNAYEEDGF